MHNKIIFLYKLQYSWLMLIIKQLNKLTLNKLI